MYSMSDMPILEFQIARKVASYLSRRELATYRLINHMCLMESQPRFIEKCSTIDLYFRTPGELMEFTDLVAQIRRCVFQRFQVNEVQTSEEEKCLINFVYICRWTILC
mgnify:CR=1 FL=1